MPGCPSKAGPISPRSAWSSTRHSPPAARPLALSEDESRWEQGVHRGSDRRRDHPGRAGAAEPALMGDTAPPLHDPVALIQKNLDEWGTPYVELDIFATDDARRIVEIVDAFCLEQLGSRLTGYLFYYASVGSTHGVQLDDGR